MASTERNKGPSPHKRAIGLIVVTLPVGAALLLPWLAGAPAYHRLEVVATGLKNPAARGTEVWVPSLQRADGTQVLPDELTLEGEWEVRDGVPVSHGAQPATLRWEGWARGDAWLTLVMHPWSGIVRVTWDGRTQSVDLYADPGGERRVGLPNDPSSAAIATRLVHSVASPTGLALLVLGLAGALAAPLIRRGRRLRLRPRWLVSLPPLLAIPIAGVFAPFMLAAGGPPNVVDQLAAWLYGVLVASVALWLWFAPEDLPARVAGVGCLDGPRIGGSPLRLTGFAALLVAGAVAAVLVPVFGLGEGGRAWVQIALDTTAANPPAARVRWGRRASDTAPLQWQPGDDTVVSLRSLGKGGTPLRVLAIETDQGPIGLEHVTARPATLGPPGELAIAPTGALVAWAQPSRAVTITLAPGTGRAELRWLDRRATVTLGTGTVLIGLRMPARFQGWALLPPGLWQLLALELSDGAAAQVAGVTVWDHGAQTWHTQQLPEPTCTAEATPAGSGTCVVQLSGQEFLVGRRGDRKLLAWALVTLVLLVVLAALAWLGGLGARVLESRDGSRANGLPSRRRVCAAAALAVWGTSLAFHLAYALYVPLGYTSDSVAYYALGRAFAAAPVLASLESVRTPGYPIVIAGVLLTVGESAIVVVVLQQLLLSLLAPLAVWALARRMPLAAASVAGLLVGLSPALTATGNLLWTESLYAFATTAALLIFIGYGERPRALLVVGLSAGAATMVRPTGFLLLATLLGWLAVRCWSSPALRRNLRATSLAATALVAGYLVLAAPWHLHLALTDGTIDLTRGHANFTAWAAAVFQGEVTADLEANRPDRAVWAVPAAWDRDPFTLLNRYGGALMQDPATRQVYYSEARREVVRVNSPRTREVRRAALVYNLTLRWIGAAGDVVWEEVNSFLDAWRASPRPPAPPPNGEGLRRLVDAWRPDPSPIRSVFVAMSRFVITHWLWLGVAALLSPLFLLFDPRMHGVVAGWIYWLTVVVSTSAISMPAERYMVVMEPMLYVFVVASAVALVHVCRTQRTTMSPDDARETR